MNKALIIIRTIMTRVELFFAGWTIGIVIRLANHGNLLEFDYFAMIMSALFLISEIVMKDITDLKKN